MKFLFLPLSLLVTLIWPSFANELGQSGDSKYTPPPRYQNSSSLIFIEDDVVTDASIPDVGAKIDLTRGCQTIGSCQKVNNHNKFDFSKQSKSPVTCSPDDAKKCLANQKIVCSPHYRVKVCVDIYLVQQDGLPAGNFTMPKCQAYCQSQGKRMLTNNEWLVAAIGTSSNSCLPAKVTKRPNYNSTTDMRNLDYNRTGIRKDRKQCKSVYGIQDMAGVLGQWVTHGQAKPGRAQFNGGLWPQNQSTIFYRTTAHGPTYTDYSIGCRCAKGL